MKKRMYDKILACLVGGMIGDAMGAPTENMFYGQIEEKYGEIQDFEGNGTDDTRVKMILCDCIIENKGMVTADEFAVTFLKYGDQYRSFYGEGVLQNMYNKLANQIELPVYNGLGNALSSHSAMIIAPMGLINACNPRQAAMETFDLAGLIHAGCSTTGRDGACAIAAAVAEAMKPDATIDSVLEASYSYLHKISSRAMVQRIQAAIAIARETGEYKRFRKASYDSFLLKLSNNPAETVPISLALFYLSKGNPSDAIIFGANYGRDADTIATMAGALAGAFTGMQGIKQSWLDKIQENFAAQEKLAEDLMGVALSKATEMKKCMEAFEQI